MASTWGYKGNVGSEEKIRALMQADEDARTRASKEWAQFVAGRNLEWFEALAETCPFLFGGREHKQDLSVDGTRED